MMMTDMAVPPADQEAGEVTSKHASRVNETVQASLICISQAANFMW